MPEAPPRALPGSSPHTRGARIVGASRVPEGGIIPAYAGSTPLAPPRHEVCGDHPRIRGEHAPSARRSSNKDGSSPHTRGAPDGARAVASSGRIIPAYAGSTSREMRASTTPMDHPRIRGEHESGVSLRHFHLGSSPHTRGALCRAWPRRRPGGIIPAYAGSTSTAGTTASRRSDHPRIRGEHGSGCRRCVRPPRIIPAYAGSTQ